LPPRGEEDGAPSGDRQPQHTCVDVSTAPSARAENTSPELVAADVSPALPPAGAIEVLEKVRALLVEQLMAPAPPQDAFPRQVAASTPSLQEQPAKSQDEPLFPFTILSGGLCEKIAATANDYVEVDPGERLRRARPNLQPAKAAERAPTKRRRRRARYQRGRRARRTTQNKRGHCPARPRWPKQKGTTAFTGPLMELEKSNYFVRHTNADPHPGLLLRAVEGHVRSKRAQGLPVWVARKWIRTDLAESQHRFSLFLLQHVDEDSHLVGKPDHKGHIIPYSIADIMKETGLSRSTVNRRISDFVLAGYIYRWQEKSKEIDEETGEEKWVSFVAHMRLNIEFFRALGVTKAELDELKKSCQSYRGYKNEPGYALGERSRRELAAEKLERARQHARERRGLGENQMRNVLGSTVIAEMDTTMTQATPHSAVEGVSRIGITAQLRRTHPDWDSWKPEARERAIRQRLRPRPPPS
jgi:Winged helix-turn-helix DNA-binding